MISNLRLADDIDLIANDLHKVEVKLNEIAQATKEVGLQIGGTIKLENNIVDEVTQYTVVTK